MTFRPEQFSNRLILPVGVFIVVLIAASVMTISSYEKLRKAEAAVAPHFKAFKKYENAVFLPGVEVLSPDGGTVNIRRDFKGKILVLNVWATWCAPCIKELPALRRVRRMLGTQGVEVVAVSIDLKNNMEKVVNFTKKLAVGDVAGYHDYEGQLQRSLPLRGLPVTFIVSPSGAVLYEITGEAQWSHPDIIDFLTFLRSAY